MSLLAGSNTKTLFYDADHREWLVAFRSRKRLAMVCLEASRVLNVCWPAATNTHFDTAPAHEDDGGRPSPQPIELVARVDLPEATVDAAPPDAVRKAYFDAGHKRCNEAGHALVGSYYSPWPSADEAASIGYAVDVSASSWPVKRLTRVDGKVTGRNLLNGTRYVANWLELYITAENVATILTARLRSLAQRHSPVVRELQQRDNRDRLANTLRGQVTELYTLTNTDNSTQAWVSLRERIDELAQTIQAKSAELKLGGRIEQFSRFHVPAGTIYRRLLAKYTHWELSGETLSVRAPDGTQHTIDLSLNNQIFNGPQSGQLSFIYLRDLP
jgi:hypothetical protein